MADLKTAWEPKERLEAATVYDDRFKKLLSETEWRQLPKAVQNRFSKRVKGGETIVYIGEVTEMKTSALGKLLAQILRPLGAPLPLSSDVGTPSVVSVTEDVTTGGQIWTRLYANKTRFPQMVHSAKRFRGPTGLEEYIGGGLSVALRVCVRSARLRFESAGYCLRLFGKTIRLPRALVPLDLVVTHEALSRERFKFSLDLRAPFFGTLIHQVGLYREERE